MREEKEEKNSLIFLKCEIEWCCDVEKVEVVIKFSCLICMNRVPFACPLQLCDLFQLHHNRNSSVIGNVLSQKTMVWGGGHILLEHLCCSRAPLWPGSLCCFSRVVLTL